MTLGRCIPRVTATPVWIHDRDHLHSSRKFPHDPLFIHSPIGVHGSCFQHPLMERRRAGCMPGECVGGTMVSGG